MNCAWCGNPFEDKEYRLMPLPAPKDARFDRPYHRGCLADALTFAHAHREDKHDRPAVLDEIDSLIRKVIVNYRSQMHIWAGHVDDGDETLRHLHRILEITLPPPRESDLMRRLIRARDGFRSSQARELAECQIEMLAMIEKGQPEKQDNV